ncbi:UNVERIFIED_CONTAM: hypothetical protein Slati_0391600 [Sesamum latifolium]|uniref:Uncharacterized protein n=1 Tax=Sesamum latifolium TaxID=2727402 RepID=A0AAW2XUN0_9LAMI
MIGDVSSSWNSPSSLHTPTAPDKAYDDHIRDMVISRTNPGYSHRVHVTAVIPQVRGLLPCYRSWGLESYRPSLQGFHMMIPRVSSVELTPSQSNPLNRIDDLCLSSMKYDTHPMNATLSASLNRTLDAHSRGPRLGTFQTQS